MFRPWLALLCRFSHLSRAAPEITEERERTLDSDVLSVISEVDMPELREFPLVTTTGATGSVFRTARFLDRAQQNLVRLNDGREFEVPSSSLQVQPDGSFLLDDGAPAQVELEAPEPTPAPQATEPPMPVNGAAETLFAEEVSIERVPVNRIVDSHPGVREEGGVTIIPVVEEVITYQKRLMLKEEVRITRRRTPVREPRKVMLDGLERQT